MSIKIGEYNMDKLSEYWYCVSPQEGLPLYAGKKNCFKSCNDLLNIVDDYKKLFSVNSNKRNVIKNLILQKPSIISNIRVLVGISDKRMYLDLTYLVNKYVNDGCKISSENNKKLIKHDTKYFIHQLKNQLCKDLYADIIAEYFIDKGILSMLDIFSTLSKEQISLIFNNLILTKENQQREAKYRGHGAEQAFAKVVKACGVCIVPENKDILPMDKYDPNVDLSKMKITQKSKNNTDCYSFDLIIKDVENEVSVLIQSLIHSSDPGQFGVNKSNESIEIKNKIEKYNNNSKKKVHLVGSVDGVGFCENPTGTIIKLLDTFDDFFQMNTLFKIPVILQRYGLIDSVLGVALDPNYFEPSVIDYFVDTYLKPAHVKNMTGQDISQYSKNKLDAGKGTIIFKNI